MDKREFLEKAGELLEGTGYSVEIRQNEELRDYVLDGEIECGLNIVSKDGEIEGFANDLDSPYPETGFAPDSLFLYLNDVDRPLHEWLSEHVLYDNHPVNSAPLEWVADFIRKSESEGWPYFSRMRLKMRKGEMPVCPGEIDADFFMSALGRTDADVRDPDGKAIHVSAAKLFCNADPENDCGMLADRIQSLMRCDIDSFPEKVRDANQAMKAWMSNYAAVCAGELYAAAEIGRIARERGGGKPLIAMIEKDGGQWKRIPAFTDEGLVKTPSENSLPLFANPKDMGENEFHRAVGNTISAMNGDVFEVCVFDADDGQVYEDSARIGRDFSEAFDDLRAFVNEEKNAEKAKNSPKLY